MKLKPFDKEKESKKIGKNNTRQRILFSMAVMIMLTVIIYQSYAIFKTTDKHNFTNTDVGEFVENDFQLAVYLDDERQDNFPVKGSGWFFEKLECNNSGSGTWNTSEWELTISGIKGQTECKIYFTESEIRIDKDANMIAVMWNGAKWVRADESNTNATYKWHDYDEKQWANVVLVKNAGTKTRTQYKEAAPGTVIDDNDILAFFVWIPRYRYKLFNTTNVGVVDQEIEVNFENKKIARSKGMTNETWLTHPAFCFGTYNYTTGACTGTEVDGFWVGKFETSADESSACYTGLTTVNADNVTVCNKTDITPRILPGKDSWRYIQIANSFTVSQSFKTNALYGLNGAASIDSHIMKNMEWGAVAYLSQSQYGKQGNSNYSGANKEIYINNYRESEAEPYRTMTGCSAGAPSTAVATTCANEYNVSGAGTGASTTGTIYGVYDMSGGTWEQVMGNMKFTDGNFYASSSGFGSAGYAAIPAAKYYDSYANDSLNSTTTNYQGALNHARGLLGDATRETLSTFGTSLTGGWYGDYSCFPHATNSWFRRGASAGETTVAGVFAFYRSGGGAYWAYSFRAVLVAE